MAVNSTKPHTAVISIDIKVHENLSGGSLNPTILSEEELKKHGMTKRATFSVQGFNLKNCLENLKEYLERLNDA